MRHQCKKHSLGKAQDQRKALLRSLATELFTYGEIKTTMTRAKALKSLEVRAWNEHQTQLFIETPYRNLKMFQTLLSTLRPQTRMCIAAGITTADEYIHTHTIAEWKKIQLPDLSKVPAIFLINK